jgi:serine/threonine protein kinase
VSNPPTPQRPRSDSVPAEGDTGRPTRDTADSAGPPPAGSADPDVRPGGRPVPEYTLLVKLGEGGFGQVWKARDDNGFEVALKFLRLDVRTGAAEQRALEVMKNVRHPHVLPMFRSWQVGSWLVLALELGDKTLYHRLAEAEKEGHCGIPRSELLEYMLESAKGLDYLHTLNIQHRDVKPQNLLLVGGSVKVADFGLAKLLEHSLASSSGSMTPAYAAPEQIQGVLSSQSDQYSLAVSYCQLRGGRLPFVGGTHEVLFGHIQGQPDLSMLPEAERPAVARALAKAPVQRWPSCRAFVEALASGAASAPPATAAATVTTTALYRRRRSKWYALGGIALAGLVAAALVLSFLKSGVERPGDSARLVDADTPVQNQNNGKPHGLEPMAVPLTNGKPREPSPTLGNSASSTAKTPVVLPPRPAPEPMASLQLEPLDPVKLRAGEQATLTVRVRRENVPDRIELMLAPLPPGVATFPNQIEVGATAVRLTLTADAGARFADGDVTITARAGSVRDEGRFRLLLIPSVTPQGDAREIIQKAVEAKGGKVNIEKYNAITYKFNAEQYDVVNGTRGFTGSQRMMLPGRIRSEFARTKNHLPGATKNVIAVVDGQKGWISADNNVSEIGYVEIAQAQQQLHLFEVTSLKGLISDNVKLIPLGESQVESKPAVGVKVSVQGQPDVSLFFDKDKYLLLKCESQVTWSDSEEVKWIRLFSDYREVDGLLLAYKIVDNFGDRNKQKWEYEMTSVTPSEKLDDIFFEKPK